MRVFTEVAMSFTRTSAFAILLLSIAARGAVAEEPAAEESAPAPTEEPAPPVEEPAAAPASPGTVVGTILDP